jgi:hypothetical protein
MRCLVKGSFAGVFEALSEAFGNIYARKFGKVEGNVSGIVLGEHYFFRVENAAAVLITVEEASYSETRVEIISCAGGHGLLDLSYGAHSDYVRNVMNFIQHSGFGVTVEEEISYFGRKR